MKSVVYQLQSDRFPRIRLGIGSQKKGDLVNFVIGGFSKEEVPVLEEAVNHAWCLPQNASLKMASIKP